MSSITSLKAREIIDSRGNPTIEVELKTEKDVFLSSVPSGASKGIYEATELRDNDKKRFNGKGVLKAVENVNKIISKNLLGKNPENQKEIDELLIKLDGTKNKSNLGANAILGTSMCVCRAGAKSKNLQLYEYIAELVGSKKFVLPIPSFNIINGGKHAGNRLSIQEFMIFPLGAENFKEAVRIGCEIFYSLKEIIKKEYGLSAVNVGDEGGFAPDLEKTEEALDLIKKAIEKTDHKNKVKIAIDSAASEFFINRKYSLNFKNEKKKKDEKTGEEMISFYKEIIKNYDIISIEDPFEQNDWESYMKFTKEEGENIQIVGDDLLVTNPDRIKEAIEKKACNALLLKLNQIGTITEAIESAKLAMAVNWEIMVSHRSGETEDTFISDFAVGLNAKQIKAGSLCRSERTAKYNRLMRIEEELGNKGIYAGKIF